MNNNKKNLFIIAVPIILVILLIVVFYILFFKDINIQNPSDNLEDPNLINNNEENPENNSDLESEENPENIPEIVEVSPDYGLNVEMDGFKYCRYNEECFKKCNKVIIPQKDEIKDFLIELPFLEEMRKNKLKLAVWDLDETLIHCIQDEPHKADIQLEIKFSSKSIKRVRIKPYNK